MASLEPAAGEPFIAQLVSALPNPAAALVLKSIHLDQALTENQLRAMDRALLCGEVRAFDKLERTAALPIQLPEPFPPITDVWIEVSKAPALVSFTGELMTLIELVKGGAQITVRGRLDGATQGDALWVGEWKREARRIAIVCIVPNGKGAVATLRRNEHVIATKVLDELPADLEPLG